MFDFIDTLRAKPDHVKNRFAIASASVVTGVIFVVWLITFTYSGDKEGSTTGVEKIDGPFKDLKTTFSHFLDQVSPEKATTSSVVE